MYASKEARDRAQIMADMKGAIHELRTLAVIAAKKTIANDVDIIAQADACESYNTSCGVCELKFACPYKIVEKFISKEMLYELMKANR